MKKDCLARVMPHPSQTGKSEEGEEKSGEQRDLVLFSHSQTRLNLSERMFTNTPQVVPILRSLAADGVQCVQPLFEFDGESWNHLGGPDKVLTAFRGQVTFQNRGGMLVAPAYRAVSYTHLTLPTILLV